MGNFLHENHLGSPNLTLLNVLNVLNLNAQGRIKGWSHVVYDMALEEWMNTNKSPIYNQS